LFLKFISHSFCGGGIVLPSGLRVSVHVLIRFFSPQKGGTLPSQCRSLMLSFRRESAIVPNRPSSVAVLSWLKSSPRTPAAASGAGFGGAEPYPTGSGHGMEGFIRFTGFSERKEQYDELSCDGDDGPLLGLGCSSFLGET
jgi:hypothetical protein